MVYYKCTGRTVDANGLVTAVNKGTADIVATTVSGNKSAKCTVTVASVARVSTDAQIATALKANVEYLYLETTEKKQLTIPQGSYAGTNLIVDMPNGEVVNHGTFASVTIKNIAKNTFKEYASGNTLNVEAATSHIVIASICIFWFVTRFTCEVINKDKLDMIYSA